MQKSPQNNDEVIDRIRIQMLQITQVIGKVREEHIACLPYYVTAEGR